MAAEWRRNREMRRHFKEKMSQEEAHHHMKPWIKASMKEKNEREGEHEIEGKKEGEKLNCQVFLPSFSFIKVTTSVTHAFIYSLGSFLKKLP